MKKQQQKKYIYHYCCVIEKINITGGIDKYSMSGLYMAEKMIDSDTDYCLFKDNVYEANRQHISFPHTVNNMVVVSFEFLHEVEG